MVFLDILYQSPVLSFVICCILWCSSMLISLSLKSFYCRFIEFSGKSGIILSFSADFQSSIQMLQFYLRKSRGHLFPPIYFEKMHAACVTVLTLSPFMYIECPLFTLFKCAMIPGHCLCILPILWNWAGMFSRIMQEESPNSALQDEESLFELPYGWHHSSPVSLLNLFSGHSSSVCS